MEHIKKPGAEERNTNNRCAKFFLNAEIYKSQNGCQKSNGDCSRNKNGMHVSSMQKLPEVSLFFKLDEFCDSIRIKFLVNKAEVHADQVKQQRKHANASYENNYCIRY